MQSALGQRYGDPESAAAALRRHFDTPLDMLRMAADMGVEVRRRPMDIRLHGLTLTTKNVTINCALSPESERFALGHELGHILVRRGQLAPPRSGAAEEYIADRFARELLLPKCCVTLREMSPAALALEHQVPLELVLSQMAGRFGWPRVIRTPGGVICCDVCGFTAQVPGCGCQRFRADAALANELLAVA